MADSDEYYEESFELDEAALASIQATEDLFGGLSQTLAVPSQPYSGPLPHGPPSKRLKTSHSWVQPAMNRVGSQPSVRPSSEREERVDNSPDIYVNAEGSYVINDVGGVCNAKVQTQSAAFGSARLETELTALRMQFSELSAAHAATKQSLREAQDEQFVKAGEVSNLRRTIDQTAREHAEAMAKMRAEKEAAEKMKAELQVKIKEETDRMTTRLIFKQQELENSTRKGIWGSARSRRTTRELSTEPSATETPSRTYPQIPPPLTVRARHETPPKFRGIGNDVIRQPIFKGFQNAFTDSAPVLTRSPKKRSETVSGSDGEELLFSEAVTVQENGGGNTAVNGSRHEGDMKQTDERLCHDNQEVSMDVDEQSGEKVSIEVMDWVEELRRIILTHIASGTDTLTLQVLLSTSLPTRMPPEKRLAFSVACQIILETCGAKHGHSRYPEDSDWETLVDDVASAFTVVGELLSDAGCIEPLVALLELITTLTLYIPAFLSSFLGPATANNILSRVLDPNGASQLLFMLDNIVRDRIAFLRTAYADKVENCEDVETPPANLVMAVVQLMECLYWNVKDCSEKHLEMISFRCHILDKMLHSLRSRGLFERTLRLLVLIATHRFSFQSLVTGTPAVESSLKDEPYLTLVESLCRYLVNPPAGSHCSTQQLIITFMALLCDMHKDAFILLDLASLVPSVIVCITGLSRYLWEDDIDIMKSPEEMKLTVETLYLATNFLHNLIFSSEISINLTHRVMEVTNLPGPFNGLTHMFMVTFGRLSWAEAPDWLDSDCKGMCEIIAELAVEVIETAVVGPEFDSLWEVWHSDEELDDEEIEAQRIQIE